MLTEILNALARRVIERRPKMSAFMAARLDTAQFAGLPSTLLAGLFLCVLGLYLHSVHAFLSAPGVTSADMRIANLLYALRDERLIAVFEWITSLGAWEVVVAMLAGAAAALRLLRRDRLAIGLWLVAAGNQLSVTLLKGFFARPRSTLGYLAETSGSFPSGHAAAAVAIWGMLFYAAWRARLAPAALAGLAAITMALLIGVSRIYLIEHYISDVLNGYLVGGMWLIAGIAFCEWRRTTIHVGVPRRRRLAALGVLSLTITVALYLASTHSRPLNAGAAAPAITVSGPMAIFTSEAAPTATETLTGDPREPIGLVVAAPDAQAISAAMQGAGWIPAPKLGLGVLSRAFWAEWTGAPPPGPRVIPTFWNDRPSELGFTAPDGGAGGGPPLHARFWRTGYRTEGMPVFVGSLTSEGPVGRAIGARRAALLSALRPSGLIALPVQQRPPRPRPASKGGLDRSP
ncbi:phosphatase PAP2 family protein [Pikeienuella sp. HZG-20]|uniref:phosphatase PAP2 family protein n=1 Tax=Paludibacillus litoralis TaxID=3133267 RepID=UPI0030ED7DDC